MDLSLSLFCFSFWVIIAETIILIGKLRGGSKECIYIYVCVCVECLFACVRGISCGEHPGTPKPHAAFVEDY